MAYQPTLEDTPVEQAAYTPTLEDTPAEISSPSVSTFMGQMPQPGAMQQNLSALSTSPDSTLGKVGRLGASILPSLLVPEIGIGGKLGSAALNALSRIGAGTAGGLAYEAPDIKSMQDLQNKATSTLGMNALLEGATWPIRGLSSMAELFNPTNYVADKAAQINNEYTAAKALQKETYAPVMQKYGEAPVTDDATNYLGFDQGSLNRFTPEIKKSYNEFLDDPNFQNLHDLQSQMGRDYSRIAINPNKINQAQTIQQSRNAIKDKIQDFLGQDPEMLDQYNLGGQITKNQVSPFEANSVLKQVSKGVYPDISSSQLTNAIQKGMRKISYEENGVPVTAIPEGHVLQNHLSDLQNRMYMANAAKFAIPAVAGAGIGEYLHPGVGGAVSGAGAGLGAMGLLSKFGSPQVAEFAQNPWVKNAMKKYLSPAYYGAGRAGIGYEEESQ